MTPDERWVGWRAVIRPTGYADSFGIFWHYAPAMASRGGYSGPYRTRDEAEQGARDWLAYWDVTDFEIEHLDDPPSSSVK